MACERYRAALSELAAGAAAPPGVEAHLATCEACRAELGALRRALALVDAELAGLTAAEPSPELAARIRAAVSASGAQRALRPAWLGPAVAVAVALLVAVAVMMRFLVGPPAREVAAGQPSPAPRVAPTPEAPAPAPPVPATELAPDPHPSPGAGRDREWRPTHSAPSEPEVLVPPGEAAALLRFAASLQRRAVSGDSLLVADLTAPLVEPAGLEIRPLEIVPLDPEWESGAD